MNYGTIVVLITQHKIAFSYDVRINKDEWEKTGLLNS